MKTLPFILILISFCVTSVAQNVLSVDASAVNTEVKTGLLKMGNPGPEDRKILVNNQYLSIAGKPAIPVMGEVHFSRIPREQWEDVLLKMKACGITIVATYVLWIHHEEIEGQFDWTGNKDLRAFARLCVKHGLYLYPRIGPWCHAEVRNGGTPDWILTKTNLKDRSNDPVYQHYAEEWYKQIGQQLHGLMYKDGGPVIGVQLENEYRHGKGGEAHILWLKNTAQRYGLDVPLYTVTGWQNGSVPPYEVIPLWGAYPDAPWADNLNRSTNCTDFRFTPYRDSDDIGNEVKTNREQYLDYSAYPYFTCEMGVGIMNTDHRRLRIGARDGLGLVMAKLGAGSNLPGYYMFAGGSNPHGLLTTLEENKEETGYYNNNPVISYDFQSAVRESGKLNGSYYEVKKLHYFLNEFGSQLAPMIPVFPNNADGLQYVVRSDKNSAFLFGLNYCRNNVSSEKKDIQFEIKLGNQTVSFPSQPVDIRDSAMFIWPVNFKIDNINLNYATAQPLCRLGEKWIFIEDAAAAPEFCFDSSGIATVNSSNGEIVREDGNYLIRGLKPGLDCIISVVSKNGNTKQLIVLGKQEAKQAWLFQKGEQKLFFVSAANMYLDGDNLHVYGPSHQFKISRLKDQIDQHNAFSDSEFLVPDKQLELDVHDIKPLDGAEWLKTSAVEKLDNKNQLRHRFFLKEFNLGNPSEIKKAQLIIATQSGCKVQLNSRWLNAEVKGKIRNEIDVTGYVQKGDNKLLLDFPFEAGENAFAACLEVEYFNTDRFSVRSNQSWITKDAYNYPSYLTGYGGFGKPEVGSKGNFPVNVPEHVKKYALTLPDGYLDGLSNLYLKVDYSGDKAKVYFNNRLVADDFNSGASWEVGLNRLQFPLESQPLLLELYPLAENARIYFDDEAALNNAFNASLKKISLVPEHQIDLKVSENNLVPVQ